MSTQLRLTGPQIYLREVRVEDVNQNYYSWLADPQINQYLETRFAPQSLDSIREFVSSKAGKADEPFYAICAKDTKQHIGNIKLGPINWHHRRADISLLIGDKQYWGKGIATEAIGLIVNFAFHELDLNKLQAGAYHKNQGSIKAFIKNGFIQEGYVKEFCPNTKPASDDNSPPSEPIDMVLMGLTKNDFLNGQ
jgi:[ribosomal protein S5]-alanine N-acetyltransferase